MYDFKLFQVNCNAEGFKSNEMKPKMFYEYCCQAECHNVPSKTTHHQHEPMMPTNAHTILAHYLVTDYKMLHAGLHNFS